MQVNIIFYIIGGIIFNKYKNTEISKCNIKTFLNPPIIGTLLGIIIFIFPIKLPTIVNSTIETIAATTTPLAMIVAGIMLANNQIKSVIKNKRIYLYCLFRLIIIPLLLFIILKLCTIQGLLLAIPVIIA